MNSNQYKFQSKPKHMIVKYLKAREETPESSKRSMTPRIKGILNNMSTCSKTQIGKAKG